MSCNDLIHIPATFSHRLDIILFESFMSVVVFWIELHLLGFLQNAG